MLSNFGKYPPTAVQIEKAASLAAKLSVDFDIPLTIDYVMTHAEAAKADGYYPDKWDLMKIAATDDDWMGGVTLREKAKWYLNKFNR